jgi:polyhydroxybutyrate depolymerase
MRLISLALLLPLAACHHVAPPVVTPSAPAPAANPTPEIVNPGPCDPTASPQCHTITVGGVTRTYWLHVPANLKPGAALIVAIHGGGGSSENMEKQTGLSPMADEKGFAVVYPDGILNIAKPPGLGWKMFYSEDFWEPGKAPDDNAYFRQLIAHLQETLEIDRTRVYVTGFSFGGYMASRLAVDLSDVFAAAGLVEGWFSRILTTDTRTVPHAAHPVSMVMLDSDHGGYCGWRTAMYGAEEAAAPPHDAELDYWSGPRGNDCGVVSTTKPLCDAEGQPTELATKAATHCKAGTEVQFYKMIGGEHGWPQTPINVAGKPYYNPAFDEKTGVTINEILWTFFAAHPKTGVANP